MKSPPIIAARLRVLEYAVIAEPVRFTGNLQLYVDGPFNGVQRATKAQAFGLVPLV